MTSVDSWTTPHVAVADDGGPISYRLIGDGERAIVLLHSLGLDGSWFEPLAASLAANARVLAPDFRGHGATPSTDAPVSLELLAADVRACMRDAGIERATIVGISLGGMVAQAFAATQADATERAVLIATSAGYDAAAKAGSRARAAAARKGLEPLADMTMSRWFGDPANHDVQTAAFEARGRAQFLAGDPEVHARFLDAMTAVGDYTVPSTVPALVVAGRDDVSTPIPVLEALAASLPQSRFAVVSGGHLTAFTNPNEVAVLIAEFVVNNAPTATR